MLTRRGWLLLATAGALWLGGRLLGLLELHVLAAATFVAVVAAVVYVRVVPLRLEVARQVRPARVHLDAPCRVDLAVANRSRRRSPVLVAEEGFDEGRLTARFSLPGLAPGGVGRAAYRVPTGRRGHFRIGPLLLRLEDPFGLAYRQAANGAAGSVLVYPRIDRVSSPAPAPGRDPQSRVRERAARHEGEDLYGLRPYEVGDDLRRVHWPASARSEDLMIRQLELPWQHRVTVVLDVRRSVYGTAAFEEAVSAAASILTAAHRAGAQVRLVTTGGFDSGSGGSPVHWEAGLAHLASARLTNAANLASTVAALRRSAAGSSVVVVSGAGAPGQAGGAGDRRTVASLREPGGSVMMVVAEDGEPGGGGAGAEERGGAGLRVVRVAPGRPLPAGWSRAPGRLAGVR